MILMLILFMLKLMKQMGRPGIYLAYMVMPSPPSAVLVHSTSDCPIEVQVLHRDIIHLLSQVPRCDIQWRYREGNAVCDAIAKHTAHQAQAIYTGTPFIPHQDQCHELQDILTPWTSLWWKQPPMIIGQL